MHQNAFGAGLRPDPLGELKRSPRPPSRKKGGLLLRGGDERERGREGREQEGKGGEERGSGGEEKGEEEGRGRKGGRKGPS